MENVCVLFCVGWVAGRLISHFSGVVIRTPADVGLGVPGEGTLVLPEAGAPLLTARQRQKLRAIVGTNGTRR